jgi:hypothetical protein
MQRFVCALCEHMFVMAHAPCLREKARSMRVERRLTIDELAERLALPRTTIYYWVRDLPTRVLGRAVDGRSPHDARATTRCDVSTGSCARRIKTCMS